MQHLTQQDFTSSISQWLVVVDFFATRCGPCRMIAPHLDTLAQQFVGRVQFYKVDVDQEQMLASQQGITAMPTLKIFKDGKEIDTIVGADLQSLVNTIQQQLT